MPKQNFCYLGKHIPSYGGVSLACPMQGNPFPDPLKPPAPNGRIFLLNHSEGQSGHHGRQVSPRFSLWPSGTKDSPQVRLTEIHLLRLLFDDGQLQGDNKTNLTSVRCQSRLRCWHNLPSIFLVHSNITPPIHSGLVGIYRTSGNCLTWGASPPATWLGSLQWQHGVLCTFSLNFIVPQENGPYIEHSQSWRPRPSCLCRIFSPRKMKLDGRIWKTWLTSPVLEVTSQCECQFTGETPPMPFRHSQN